MSAQNPFEHTVGGAFRLTSPEFEDKVKMTERGKLLLLAPPPLDPNYFRGLRLIRNALLFNLLMALKHLQRRIHSRL